MRHPLVVAFVLLIVGTPAISAAQTVSVSPEILKVFPGTTSSFTVMLSEPAAVDTFVTATSSDPTVAFAEGGGVTIAAGQAAGGLIMNAVAPGNAQVTVSLGMLMATAQVVVTGLVLTPDPLSLQTDSTANMTVSISAAAGPQGSAVQLSSAGLITVPALVTIPGGETTVTFSVAAGNTAGTTQLSASSADGVDVATVVVGAGAARALALNPDPLTLLTNSAAAMSLSLSEPAPPGGLSVSLSSGTGVVSVPGTIQISAGTAAATFQVSAGATAGSDQVVATASGYSGDAANVVVTASFDELACRIRTRDAAEAGRAYAKTATDVARACKTRDAGCDLALEAVAAAYAQVAAAQSAVLAACR